MIVADEVTAGGKSWQVPWPGEQLTGEWRPMLHRDRLVSTPRLIAAVADKQALAADHRAGVVDMEAATVAEVCERAAVPFGCIKAVSDDCRTPLSPKLAACLSGGRVAPLRLLAATATSPRLVAQCGAWHDRPAKPHNNWRWRWANC